MKTHEDINSLWSDSSNNYDSIIHDELSSFRVKGWQEMIKSYADGKRKTLDIGCGPGFFTVILAKAGYDVTAVDGADGMLEKARQNIVTQGVKAEVKKMYCDKLDFENNTFDLVLSRNVTHALDNHKVCYIEWMRVLKHGGVLLIFDANWHLPMASEKMYQESCELVKQCIEKYGSDFGGNTTYEDAIKNGFGDRDAHFLGDKVRPDWDVGMLEAIGYTDICYNKDITASLWDDKEKLIFKNTPMFMVKAVKPLKCN